MGAAKGEPQDEEVPTPTKEVTGEPTAVAEGEKQMWEGFFVYNFRIRFAWLLFLYAVRVFLENIAQ